MGNVSQRSPTLGVPRHADGQCREKKSLKRLSLELLRRSIKGGSGESVAAPRATGRRDWRRSRGRMMYATTAENSAKKITTKTVSTRVPSGAP